MVFFSNLLVISLDAAPYLLFGLIIAGMIKSWLPESWVRKQLNGTGVTPVVKASLLGAPMPLCSCSVLPVALSIRRAGAGKGATTSFLVSTPETGVDSISLTYALLGPVMAVVRPIAAIFSALVAGIWVGSNEEESPAVQTEQPVTDCCSSKTKADEVEEPTSDCHSNAEKEPEATSCCSAKKEPEQQSCCASKKTDVQPEVPGCCASEKKTEETAGCGCTSAQPTKPSLMYGVKYALGQLYSDIALWLAIGLLLAAAVQSFVSTEWLAAWGSGWSAKIVMLLVGIPIYICASASTPIAAALMLAGVSPGTVLVFLLAGPATNGSTIAIIRNELGKNVIVKYLISVMGCALFCGWLVDLLLVDTILLKTEHHAHGSFIPTWLASMSLILLLILAVNPVRQKIFDLLPD